MGIYPKLRAIHSLTPRSNQSQESKLPYKEAVKYLDRLRSKLEVLEDRPGLPDRTRSKINDLLELFDHVEMVERQLVTLTKKDRKLDADIRNEFVSLSRACDGTVSG